MSHQISYLSYCRARYLSIKWVLKVLLALLLSLPALVSHADNFVGGETCRSCHKDEYKTWQGSHHDLAMQLANKETVLGNFDNASITLFGVTSFFYKTAGKFMVRTEGAKGTLEEFEIKYTFGFDPLQQYLIEFPGGRLQALSLAWDARPKKQGGQRWFHLYPNEKIAFDDELHWTKPSQNWNNMCADCHSTRLKKNYDPVSKTFKTTWSEINVSCEACHGPGADHVRWADKNPGWEKLAENHGLQVSLDELKDVRWTIKKETGNAERSRVRSSEKEIETCARCHSRRSPISSDYVHGERLLDHYLPRLLHEGLYFSDGQINDEVYVYGSFLQSEMYHDGVTCSDCHEPHSLALRSPGNEVCLQCHQEEKYENAKHHFHKPESSGASCAECHMPPRTYMVVDPRHDHSMRIPRPDISVKLGTPNACNICHNDKDAKWAAKQVETWYEHVPEGFQTYAPAIYNARHDVYDGGKLLATLIRDTHTPNIARATALAEIGPYLSPNTLDVLPLALSDKDPIVRTAAVNALENVPINIRVPLAFPMLEDPVRAVRIESARVLADIPLGDLPAGQRTLLENTLQEYITAQQASAERAEAQTNMGNLYIAQGKIEKAKQAYKTATELNPAFTPGYVNLADLYRAQGNETKAEKVLRQAAGILPKNADIHYALGLSLARQKQNTKALKELRLASILNPENAHYIYVYAVALNSTGKQQQAIMVLQGAHNHHPKSRDILSALVAFNRDIGNEAAASRYNKKLRAMMSPTTP